MNSSVISTEIWDWFQLLLGGSLTDFASIDVLMRVHTMG